MTDIRHALQSVPLLAPLSTAFLDRLAECSTIRVIRKGETLFCQGEPSPFCFGILSGAVSLQQVPKDRRLGGKILRTLGPGDVFGESSLFDDSPRVAMASASESGELVVIQGKKFREMILSEPVMGVPLLMGLLNSSLQRLRHTSQELSLASGLHRLLHRDYGSSKALDRALEYVKGALDGIDDVMLLKRMLPSDPFQIVYTSPGVTSPASWTFENPLVQYVQTMEGLTMVSPSILRSWVTQAFLPWPELGALALLPLHDPQQEKKALIGILLLSQSRDQAALSVDHIQLMASLAHPLAQALAVLPSASTVMP